ncbi:glyoxalase [Persicitalea jodogahamensis]|uniref:Glyoxalase n=1 Tax=Persicitalea jodogahamensis TaxID=402147 RepID=A0A8J3D8U5_9BACT|nr:glyoxalase [Persicitalea jodogahamensis]GHB62415.1 hypothetical protein GCM10007390_15290 [Persicitalea jodogahamensis]
MNQKDKWLLALRPEISTSPALNLAEEFQNSVLRPILKFQHERISALFQAHIQKRKVNLSGISLEARKDYVEAAFHKDLALRHQLIGLALALMTEKEWLAFSSDKELARRLNNLLVQRIQSTLP